MFKLTDETRATIVTMLRDRFELTQDDETINSVIDDIVNAVKAQFGM